MEVDLGSILTKAGYKKKKKKKKIWLWRLENEGLPASVGEKLKM